MHLSVFSELEQLVETLFIAFDEDGWFVFHKTTGGLCAKTGQPHLQDYFTENQTPYPEFLSVRMSDLWEECHQNALKAPQIEALLRKLGEEILAFHPGVTQN